MADKQPTLARMLMEGEPPLPRRNPLGQPAFENPWAELLPFDLARPVEGAAQALQDGYHGISKILRSEYQPGRQSEADAEAIGQTGLGMGVLAGGTYTGAGLAGGMRLPRGVLTSAGGRDETATKGIRAFHGSPHDFDRFDMSKIGTGEGAQAYGHGLYFAETEGVARSYKDKLGGLRSGFAINGKEYDPIGGAREAARLASNEKLNPAVAREVLAYHDKTPDEMIAEVKRWPGGDRDANILAAAEWRRANRIETGGRMYEVRIDAEPEDLLDWDKPLSQQSEKVRALLAKPEVKWQAEFFNDPDGEKLTGKAAYSAISKWNSAGDQRNVPSSQALRDAGIPGIRYLDQGSRAAGEGSRNYVLFRDDIIEIVRKYGVAAAVSTYGADMVMQAMQGQEQQNR